LTLNIVILERYFKTMAHFVSRSPVYVIQAPLVRVIQETAVVAVKPAEKNMKQRRPVTISHSTLKTIQPFLIYPH
jgi:hypothetical protein